MLAKCRFETERRVRTGDTVDTTTQIPTRTVYMSHGKLSSKADSSMITCCRASVTPTRMPTTVPRSMLDSTRHTDSYMYTRRSCGCESPMERSTAYSTVSCLTLERIVASSMRKLSTSTIIASTMNKIKSPFLSASLLAIASSTFDTTTPLLSSPSKALLTNRAASCFVSNCPPAASLMRTSTAAILSPPCLSSENSSVAVICCELLTLRLASPLAASSFSVCSSATNSRSASAYTRRGAFENEDS
mmetsp:Transcript_3786/g.10441  ORF Transcript_3786/g.10441 Transcript_3786/m.10441 type:complete len:246 (+) Transcript_3786:112-849(+)